MSKYLVFDFDGVIINSHELQAKALKESYQYYVGEGEVPYLEFFRNSGDSLSNIFSKLNLPEEMVGLYTKISENNLDMIVMHDGIRRMLNRLTENGFKIALCTGKERKRTLEILNYFQIEEYFTSVVCSDDVEYPKPNPESLIKSINNMNGCIEHTVMIGDGINDIICAKNAGVYSIGVSWGDTGEKIFVNAQPDIVVDSVEQLYEKIQEKYVVVK